MGRMAIIKPMHVGKFVCRFVGVMLVGSSGSRVFQWAVEERGRWRGYLSRICVIHCWSNVCVSGFISAQAYVLMW
jgi:L-asparagine transporter-like permease